jgi:hypothetical protein
MTNALTQDNSYGTPIPFGQTTALAQSVIDTAILVWEQMGLSTAQIMYGIAMLNVESGDTPVIPNNSKNSTIRGLGQFSNGQWDYAARQFNSTYNLSIPANLNPYAPTNADFNVYLTAGTNVQSGESNDPAAGPYDPQGLVEQLEVDGQGIKDEWQLADDALTGENAEAAARLNSLIDQGVAGSTSFDINSQNSALLTTVALVYLGHHEGLWWWTSDAHVATTTKDLDGGLDNRIASVLSAFEQEFSYLQDSSLSQSAIGHCQNSNPERTRFCFRE